MRPKRKVTVFATGTLLGLAGCATNTTTGILLDAKSGAPIANAWIWSVSETRDVLLQKPILCETFSIARTASDGTFSLPIPSGARFVSAFYPGFALSQRGVNALTRNDALYLESQITLRPTNSNHVLTPNEQHHEYPPIAQAVKPRQAIFPLWREDQEPALAPAESVYALPTIQSCSSDKGALPGTPPRARQQLIDAIPKDWWRKKLR